MILPPKRYEDPFHPKFDPIRWRPWFGKLIKRREKIPMLKQAMLAMGVGGLSQKDAAERYGVDERELRDYENFYCERGTMPAIDYKSKEFQCILDEAYKFYCLSGGEGHIKGFIEAIAPSYGMNPRHVYERYEIDATFLPTGHKPSL